LSDYDSSLSDRSRSEVSTFELERQNLIEEVVQPETTAVELLDIEGNMIDHWIADMPDGTVHEIVEHNFQELEHAARY